MDDNLRFMAFKAQPINLIDGNPRFAWFFSPRPWGGRIAGNFAKHMKGFWPRRVAGANPASLPKGKDEFLEI